MTKNRYAKALHEWNGFEMIIFGVFNPHVPWLLRTNFFLSCVFRIESTSNEYLWRIIWTKENRLNFVRLLLWCESIWYLKFRFPKLNFLNLMFFLSSFFVAFHSSHNQWRCRQLLLFSIDWKQSSIIIMISPSSTQKSCTNKSPQF